MAVFASNLCSALPETFDQLLTSDATAAISLSSKVGSRVERVEHMFSPLSLWKTSKCVHSCVSSHFSSLSGTIANPAVNSCSCQKIGGWWGRARSTNQMGHCWDQKPGGTQNGPVCMLHRCSLGQRDPRDWPSHWLYYHDCAGYGWKALMVRYWKAGVYIIVFHFFRTDLERW